MLLLVGVAVGRLVAVVVRVDSEPEQVYRLPLERLTPSQWEAVAQERQTIIALLAHEDQMGTTLCLVPLHLLVVVEVGR